MRTPRASDLIAAERQRQRQHGFDAKHDDQHDSLEIFTAAKLIIDRIYETNSTHFAKWAAALRNKVFDKHQGNLAQQLVIAGALIEAQIEVILRADAKEENRLTSQKDRT